MSAKKNKKIIRNIFEKGMNKKDMSAIEKYIDPQYMNHDMPMPGPGPAGLKAVMDQFFDAFPDMHIILEEEIGDGDYVATRGYWTGTNKGSFMGMPATGKTVKASFMDFWKLKDGKCVENWVRMDNAAIIQQLNGSV